MQPSFLRTPSSIKPFSSFSFNPLWWGPNSSLGLLSYYFAGLEHAVVELWSRISDHLQSEGLFVQAMCPFYWMDIVWNPLIFHYNGWLCSFSLSERIFRRNWVACFWTIKKSLCKWNPHLFACWIELESLVFKSGHSPDWATQSRH